MMDHLPLPHQCSFAPILVPCLADILYDDGNWYTFPERHGWQVNQIRGKTIILRHEQEQSLSDTTAFLQSWLYFGLLRTFLGDHFDVDAFIEETDGRRRITTKNLEPLLHKWSVQIVARTTVKDEISAVYDFLVEHRGICLPMYMVGLAFSDDWIMPSIAILSERLAMAINHVHYHLGFETPVEQTWRLHLKEYPDFGQPFLDLIKTRGWCPYDLGRLDIQTKELSILYYYSNLPPPRSSKDHSDCSDDRCFAMMTNPLTYRLSHRHNTCNCPLLYAEQSVVASILRNNSIPLIAISYIQSNPKITDLDASNNPKITVMDASNNPKITVLDASNNPKITVLDAAEGHDFVAISHVWAEGAGNVKDNALQTCTLMDILCLIRRLPWEEEEKTYAFWIDTLCVPVRPPQMQTLALNKMRDPYERAKHVLVLDSHLRSLDSSKLSPTEVFAQVTCSSWMRRLWTLQEGRLAQRVWFQFADKAVDVKRVFENLDRSRVPSRIEFSIQAALYVQLWLQIWTDDMPIRNTGAVTALIFSTRFAVSSRSVSVPSDEALCLFTLMGMDLRQITTVPAAKRMEILWRKLSKVPISFLFSKASKKMCETGLHWAPASFLGLQSEKEWIGPQDFSSPGETDPHAIPTPLGLMVTLPGVRLHPGLVRRMQVFDYTWNADLLVEDGSGVWYALRVDEPWRQDSEPIGIDNQLAVVLGHSMCSEGARRRTKPDDFSFQCHSVGVLVSVSKTDDECEVINAKAYNHVALEHLGPGLQQYLSSAEACVLEANMEYTVLLDETHSALKERYRTIAKNSLDDKDLLDVLARKARHFGTGIDYESLLDDFLDTVVVTARFGDRCQIQKIHQAQQCFWLTVMHQCKTFTISEIGALIAAGNIIVINKGNVLRLNTWLDRHPGGRLVIQHMVGRDATDEISM
ncbi:MAG: hypothetical protein Q9218_003997 [Villophora microphyllina]